MVWRIAYIIMYQTNTEVNSLAEVSTGCFIKKQPLWFFIISLPNCKQFL